MLVNGYRVRLQLASRKGAELENLASSATHPSVELEATTRPVWRFALICGATAGIISWIAVEFTKGAYKPELVKQVVISGTFIQPTLVTQSVADTKNAILSFALLGGVMAFAMGLAGGLAARSIVRGLVVGLIGATIGALVGAGVTRLVLPFFYRRLAPDPNDVMTPILIHGGIWTAIGAVSAIAFAIGIKARRDFFYIVVNACVAAFSASFLYHTAAEGLFPTANSSEPIASAARRATARSGLCHDVSGRRRRKRRDTPHASTGCEGLRERLHRPRSLGILTRSVSFGVAPQGVALGWYVQPLRGKIENAIETQPGGPAFIESSDRRSGSM